MLGPCCGPSLENALASGESALTGPVARGDAGTVAAPREALRELRRGLGHGDILEAYMAMARATARARWKPRAAEAGRKLDGHPDIQALDPAPDEKQ